MENGEPDEEVGEVAAPQRGDDARELDSRGGLHEAGDGSFGGGRGNPDDLEGKAEENGGRAAGVVGKEELHGVDAAEAERNRGEGELGVAELEEVLNVSLGEVDEELAELGKGAVRSAQPVAIVLEAEVRLRFRERLLKDSALHQQIRAVLAVRSAEEEIGGVDRWEGEQRGREQSRLFGAGIVVPTVWEVTNKGYFRQPETAQQSVAPKALQRWQRSFLLAFTAFTTLK